MNQSPKDTRPVQSLLNDLGEAGGDHDEISVADIVEAIGHEGLGAMILVPALIMITPASGIPGLSTAAAMIVLLAAVQMAIGRDTIWLPDFISRQSMARSKLDKARHWIEPPIRWIDRLTRRRLVALVARPWNLLPLTICIGIACVVPVLEFVPFSASLAACAIAFFGLGFVARDGLLVAIGLLVAAGVGALVWYMVG